MGIGELSHLLGARRISFLPDGNFENFSSVAIDSRNVTAGALFFALAGAVCDGHSFVNDAFSAGAVCAVVESSKLETFDLVNNAKKTGKDLIIVENTMKSLQSSAKIYLDKFPQIIKIGITGSSGKTTTKEITAAIISCEKNTVTNKGNLNSETGLPLSIFDIRAEHEVCIFELGMNKPGEISGSAGVLKPNIALITNIGSAHIGNFGSKDKIVNEKKCIFQFLNNNDSALIPANDEYAKALAQGVKGNIKFYGAFEELEGTRSLGLDGTEISWAGEKINFTLPGKHCLDDAFAAIAIAKEIPVSNKAIKQGLESVKPLFGRLEILKGRTTVILDCYNANPQSMEKSIEFCDSVEWDGRKIYVMGNMLELGSTSLEEHKKLGGILALSGAEKVFMFGSEMEGAVSALNGKQYFHTNNIDDLSAALDCYVKPGDLVLLKGSRGCALERLTDMLVVGSNQGGAGVS